MDWSDPTHVVLTTTDSNIWGGRSSHSHALKRQPNGTTDVDVIVVREGKNFKGWLLGIVLWAFGNRVLGKAFANSIKPIEACNYKATTAAAARA
jgi:hypothetical protein